MEGWKLPAGSQGVGPSAGHKQRSSSSWQPFPGASSTRLHEPPEAFEKMQACPQGSPSSLNPSSKPHGSCPTACVRCSWAPPSRFSSGEDCQENNRSPDVTSRALLKAAGEFQFLSLCHSDICSFLLHCLPGLSFTLHPAFPSHTVGSREDSATHHSLDLLPQAQEDREHWCGWQERIRRSVLVPNLVQMSQPFPVPRAHISSSCPWPLPPGFV